jgi:hypothetical protein
MHLKDGEFARRDADGVEARADARLSWLLENLITSDAHCLEVRLGCGIRVAENSADRRMFAQVVLGSRSSVGIDVLADDFAPAIQAAAAAVAAQHSATDATEHRVDQEMLDALQKASESAAFARGLQILPPFQLQISSPSLEQSRLEQSARARAEERAAGQIRHVQRAAELLKHFKQLQAASPDLSAGSILEQLSATERGAALQTLLLASAQQATSLLWAVAGSRLLRIDPRAPGGSKVDQIELSSLLGPLRSVQPADSAGAGALLIGAQSGVFLVHPDDPGKSTRYEIETGESQLGFNSAAVTDGRIWACHGDAGVVAWPLEDGKHPVIVAPPTPIPMEQLGAYQTAATAGSPSLMGTRSRLMGPRNVTAIDDHWVIYSTGSNAWCSDGKSQVKIDSSAQSELVAIIGDASSLILIHENGTLDIVDRKTRQVLSSRHVGGSICAASELPWLGGRRILLATAAGPIDCIGLDDSVVTRFSSRYSAMRAVAAAADFVAAISPDRQRIALWHSHQGAEPCAEIHVASIARHRAADIVFA